MTVTAITTDEPFGGCPECGGSDGYINAGQDHWSVCDTHRTKWWIGSNLFSSWRYESEREKAESAIKLARYREVGPVW